MLTEELIHARACRKGKCPRAATIVCVSRDAAIQIPISCNRYDCPHCGKVRRHEKYDKAIEGLADGTWTVSRVEEEKYRAFTRRLNRNGKQYLTIRRRNDHLTVIHQCLPESVPRDKMAKFLWKALQSVDLVRVTFSKGFRTPKRPSVPEFVPVVAVKNFKDVREFVRQSTGVEWGYEPISLEVLEVAYEASKSGRAPRRVVNVLYLLNTARTATPAPETPVPAPSEPFFDVLPY